ncbi:MAG: hypothetical protein LJE95_03760 [Acidobacteria bacterium]|jgi:hypothetical protein|nr:hypothetical protein [Acidobacteriota bacterium]
MLLRARHVKASTFIGAGQLSLVAGLVLERFAHPGADFWQGFVAGLTGVLIGLSLVLNLRGLTLARQERKTGG